MQDNQDVNMPSTSGPLASPSGKIQVDQSSNKRLVDQSHADLSNFTGVMNTGDMTVHGDIIVTAGHVQTNTEQPSSAPGESAENPTMRLEEELSSKLKERAEIVAGQMNLPVETQRCLNGSQ
ncbi:unnamed protein product [Clavelina lepadiformis]|uniref:Late embryogenesis abundant protein n=1 Tax=Clavelina lepadiformis TaxID=159417 RepID=A0ABP0GQ76_CLALP